MTSYMEQIIEGLGKLAPIMQSGLAEVRQKDEMTRNALKAINKEESDLVEELKLLAKAGADFDEEPLKNRAQSLINRRREISLILDDQNKYAIGIYHHLDQRIKDFDVSTKSIAHLFPDTWNPLETDETRRKKKRKSSSSCKASAIVNSSNLLLQEDDGFDTLSVFDPNEPKYCKCRRISFGSMVACENPDCAIEWFHFECVGLKVEPADPWFCPTCREPPSKHSSSSSSENTVADVTVAMKVPSDKIPNDGSIS